MSYIFNEVLTISTGVGVGGTPITGGTDTAILFQRGTVLGEDTNFEWDYTNHILNFGATGHFNATSTYRWDIAGTSIMDWGISTASVLTITGPTGLGTINAAYLTSFTTSGSAGGLYVALTTDIGNRRLVAALDGNNNSFISFGLGTNPIGDIGFYRDASGILGVINSSSAGSPAGMHVYKTSDTTNAGTPPTANYERGTLDWSTSNVFSVGTQANGTGSLRDMHLVGNFASASSYINVGGNGTIGAGLGVVYANTGDGQFGIFDGTHSFYTLLVSANTQGFNMASGWTVTWSSNAQGSGNSWASLDTGVSRSAAGVIAFGNGTQNDASATIKAKTKAGAPTTSDVPAGCWILIRDTTNATTKMYYNNAGTLQTVALV